MDAEHRPLRAGRRGAEHRSRPGSGLRSAGVAGERDQPSAVVAVSVSLACGARRPLPRHGGATGADRRGRCRDGPVGQVGGSGRHRPHRHLQLRSLPDGGTRLAGGAARLRQRQRDRGRDGSRGPARGPPHPRARRRERHRSLLPAAPVPQEAQGHGFRRRAELPDRRPDRRGLPAEPGGDGDGLRPRGGDDPPGPRARPAHHSLRVQRGRRRRDGRGGRRHRGVPHGSDHRREHRGRDGAHPGRLRRSRGPVGCGGARGATRCPRAVPRRSDRRAIGRDVRAPARQGGPRLLRRLQHGTPAHRAGAEGADGGVQGSDVLMPTVVLAGTLDTKGHEYAFVRDRVREHGVDVLLVDVGVYEPQVEPDISRQEVARAAGADVQALADSGDRGEATAAMGRGAAALLLDSPRAGPAAGCARPRRLGRVVDRDHRDARPAGRRAEADGVDAGLRRHATLRGGRRRHDDVFGRRHRRDQLGVGPHPVQRGGRHRRHGPRDGAADGPPASRGGVDVRRDDPRGDAGPRAARGARVRGAGVPRHGDGRAVDGEPGHRRVPRRRPRPDDHRAGRRAGRRCAVGRTGPARGRGCCRRTAGGLPRSSRHGELRTSRHGPGAVRGTQPLRPQPDHHPDAHDAGGVRESSADRSAGSCPRPPARRPCSCLAAASR